MSLKANKVKEALYIRATLIVPVLLEGLNCGKDVQHGPNILFLTVIVPLLYACVIHKVMSHIINYNPHSLPVISLFTCLYLCSFIFIFVFLSYSVYLSVLLFTCLYLCLPVCLLLPVCIFFCLYLHVLKLLCLLQGCHFAVEFPSFSSPFPEISVSGL